MDSIKINITLPKASEIKKDLDSLLNQIRKNSNVKLDLDTKQFENSVNQINQLLRNVKAQMSSLGGAENLFVASGMKEANDQIERQNKLLKEQRNIREGIIKTSTTIGLNSEGDRVLVKELERVRDEYGQIIDRVTTYNRETGKISDVLETTTDEVEKQQKAYERLEESVAKVKDSLQNKLNQSMANQGFTGISDDVFKDFQLRINDLDIETTTQEIRELQRELTNLGNSDSQIIRLQNAISRHEASIVSLKDKYKDLVPENELAVANARLNELRRTLEEIQSGDFFTNKQISNTLNEATNSMRELGNATRNAKDHFGEIAKRVGLFDIAYDTVNMIQDAFKNGVQSVIDMNTALSDLNKVVPLSNAQLEQMRDSAVQMGEALGRSAVDIAQAQAEFGRMTKDTNEINELVRSATIGANTMGGVSSDEVAKGLTTIMSSLNIEASKSIDIINSLNEVQNNFTISSKDLMDGLAEVGSVAETAGLSLDELNGYMTAIQQSTGKTGDSIGTSLNSILSRLYRTGRGGMEASGQSENALASVGVALRDANGEFRKAGDVLDDLNKVWGTLSETQQIYTAQQIAGTTQFNELVSLMQNYDTAVKATETSIDSLGSAEKENEIYLQSIQGRMESLTATMQGFFFNFIDSDLIKGGISALQGLVSVLDGLQNTFGSLGLTVGVLSTTFMAFTNNPLRQLADDMVKHKTTIGGLSESLRNIKTAVTEAGVGMSGVKKATAGLSAGFQAIGNSAIVAQVKVVALQTALSVGLSFAIAGIIAGLTKLVDWLVVTDKEARELNENLTSSIQQTSNTVAQAEEMLSKRKALESEIANTGDTERRVELEGELLEIERQLAGILPSSATGFDEQGNAISQNNDIIQEQINLKKEQMEIDALALLKNNQNIGAQIENAQKLKDEYEAMKLAILNNDGKYEATTTERINGRDVETTTVINIDEEDLKKKNEEILNLNTTIAEVSQGIETLKKRGWSDGEIASIYPVEAINEYNKSLEENNKLTKENTKAKEENAKVGAVSTVNEDTVKKYSEAINGLDKVQSLINSINEEQGITPTILSELAKEYPELGANISDVAEVQKFLNEEIQRQTDLANESYTAMVETDNNFYDNKFLKNEEWMNQIRKSLVDMGMASEDAYNLDLKQFDNLQHLKRYAMDTLGDGVEKWLSQYIDVSADGYDIDFNNFKSVGEAKLKILNALDAEVQKLTNNLAGVAKLEGIANNRANLFPEYGADGMFARRIQDETEKQRIAINSQLSELNKVRQELNTRLPDFNLNLTKGFVSGIGGISSIGGSGSGSGSKSATEKSIADIENTVDLYYQTKNAIQKLNNALEQNQALMENSKDEERIKYLRQEIDLLNQKKVALDNNRKVMQQELAELRKQLDLRNFSFGADGQITNYSQRLGFLEQWANSAVGEEKESRQNNVKYTVELIKEYTDLLLDEIPSVTNEIQELGNQVYETNEEIKDLYMEKLEAVGDVEGQITDLISKQAEERIEAEKKVLEEALEADRKRLESRRKALEEEQKIFNDAYEEENYQAELNEQRNKLLEIQNEIDQLQFASDQASIQKVRELTLAYEDQRQVINDMIRENQNEATNERFEQEMELIDKEIEARENYYDQAVESLDRKLEEYLSPENLTNLVSEAMSSGMINVLGQTESLNDAMLKMYADTETGVANINLQYSNWLETLESIKGAMTDVNFLMTNAGLGNAIDPKTIPKTTTPTNVSLGDIIINGNADSSILPEIQNMMNRQRDEIYKTMAKKLSGGI